MTLKIAPTPILTYGRAATATLRETTRNGLRHLLGGSLLLAITPLLSTKPALAQAKIGAPVQVSVGTNNSHPDNNSDEVALPPNGDFVVFSSDATNILPSGRDTNGARDLFLFNKGSVSLLSVAPDGTPMGPNSVQEKEREQAKDPNYLPNLYPAVSRVLPDDSYGVTFTSSAPNLLPAGFSDPEGYDQVYLRIPKFGKTVLISGNPITKQAGNGPSFGSSITYIAQSSGRNRFLVVFTSCATNLDTTAGSGGGPGGKRLYLATVDISGSVPTVSSVSLLGGEELIRPALEDLADQGIPDVVPLVYLGGVDFDSPVISGDGSTVAFTLESPRGVTYEGSPLFGPILPQVFRFLRSNENALEAISKTEAAGQEDGEVGNGVSVHPSVSFDGKLVAFSTTSSNLGVGATSDQPKFVVWKDSDNSLNPINKAADGTLSNGTGFPTGMISPDGRYALWSDDGSNLVAGDTNGVSDIFLKGLDDNSIQLISKTPEQQLNANSFHPAIGAPFSGTELRMAFASRATNLGTTGSPDVSRVFVSKPRSLPEPEIKKNAPIPLPPEVAVKKRSITVRFLKFRLPSRGKWTTNSTAEMEAFMAAATRGKITYEIISNIKTKKRFNRIQSRNRVTLEQIKPGTYQVSYRAIAQIGKKRIVTKKSPVTRFTVK